MRLVKFIAIAAVAVVVALLVDGVADAVPLARVQQLTAVVATHGAAETTTALIDQTKRRRRRRHVRTRAQQQLHHHAHQRAHLQPIVVGTGDQQTVLKDKVRTPEEKAAFQKMLAAFNSQAPVSEEPNTPDIGDIIDSDDGTDNKDDDDRKVASDARKEQLEALLTEGKRVVDQLKKGAGGLKVSDAKRVYKLRRQPILMTRYMHCVVCLKDATAGLEYAWLDSMPHCRPTTGGTTADDDNLISREKSQCKGHSKMLEKANKRVADSYVNDLRTMFPRMDQKLVAADKVQLANDVSQCAMSITRAVLTIAFPLSVGVTFPMSIVETVSNKLMKSIEAKNRFQAIFLLVGYAKYTPLDDFEQHIRFAAYTQVMLFQLKQADPQLFQELVEAMEEAAQKAFLTVARKVAPELVTLVEDAHQMGEEAAAAVLGPLTDWAADAAPAFGPVMKLVHIYRRKRGVKKARQTMADTISATLHEDVVKQVKLIAQHMTAVQKWKNENSWIKRLFMKQPKIGQSTGEFTDLSSIMPPEEDSDSKTG